ncbi:ABC transporter ATP-binding protein [Peptoniphilus equinus]|uniref:ABC transporter ATP-binding protein n=1 Tax=Peptoniphilus equinus TaxID=3016343 RepID=A0ABY7QUP4_9FIRM|nr:ABC transporter ATP-binding protein [Peptoniphilus equinus]WBW50512.1 ABC transporter ATP-binding protein [Peptoniphilus equinus]
MSLLEVSNLSVYYGHIHAIKTVSLVVEEGEIVSLIGANGAGKTTTLQTISGIVPSSSGHITFNGMDITAMRAHTIVQKGISQVPEGRRVFKQMSVEDNLKLGAFTKRTLNEKDLQFIYSIFPVLEERKRQDAGTLSGGEQQMLAMGRAMMARPKLLLLDEPSMGLSPLFVKEIFATINKLHEWGTTILLVEQNAKMALEISDRAYVLQTGVVALEGDAKELMNKDEVRKAYLGG